MPNISKDGRVARISRRGFLASATALSIVPARAAEPVTVASKIDTEGGLIGEMMLALLQAAGIPTRNRLQLGPTRILRAAILSGAIDLYPEYTGNAAFFFGMDGDPVWKDEQAGYERARTLDLQRNNLVWLSPAPADNSWVIAMRGDLADAHRLATLEDFARWTREGGVKLAASAEFVESRSGLPAFQETYGFALDARQLLVLSGGNTSATIKAAADGISGVNSAMAYGTDGALVALGLRALKDSKHAQPVYAPAPVVRAAIMQSYPQIAGILAPAFARLDLGTLRGLNEQIAIQGREARLVARKFLQERGLLA
ncbi:MAG: ABC transporter substrate-binding protein [Methylobacteriaceae bacterium]|nr:ABC transporter substrate-binding protein [Methylobacteriaceae bacterium]